MAKVTVIKAISDYYGVKGGGTRVTMEEMKALTPAAKLELATGIVAITGDELIPPTPKPGA